MYEEGQVSTAAYTSGNSINKENLNSKKRLKTENLNFRRNDGTIVLNNNFFMEGK